MNTTDERLWDLLATWEEKYRQGQDVPAEELCRDCPELARELAANITALKRMDWLLKPLEDDDPAPTNLPFDFGEYTVIERIGTGGMGQVFKALHRRMDRIVALKILPEGSVKSADALARFQQEVRSAGKLVHPNIVTAYDAGEHDGSPFLVRELVEGRDLFQHIQEHGPLPVTKAVEYILQAARGLEYAHGKLAGGFYGSLSLWDTGTGKLLRTWQGHRTKIHGVAFRPDGKVIASGGGDDDSTVRLWDVASGKQLQSLQGHKNGVWSVAFSPDGRFIVSCGHEGTIRLWDAESGEERKRLEGNEGPVFGVTFASDGRHVASCGDDKTVRLWDVTTGQQVRTFEGHTSPVWAAAISHDGKRLISGDLASVACVWNVETGELIHRLRSPTRAVFCVAFSPDSRFAATGGGKAFLEKDGWKDFTICLWEVERGLLLKRNEGHTAVVWGLAWMPDGDHFVSCGYDGLVRMWPLPSSQDR